MLTVDCRQVKYCDGYTGCLCSKAGRGDLPEKAGVPGDDAGAEKSGEQAGNAKEAAEGQARLAGGLAADVENDAVKSRKQRADEQSEERGGEAEESGNHGQEFDVAEAEALPVANGLVGPANNKKKQSGGTDGEQASVDEGFGAGEKDVAACGEGAGAAEAEVFGGEDDLILAGEQEEGLGADEEKAGGDAGEGEGVGEAVGLPVDDDEGDEEEAEEGRWPGRRW